MAEFMKEIRVATVFQHDSCRNDFYRDYYPLATPSISVAENLHNDRFAFILGERLSFVKKISHIFSGRIGNSGQCKYEVESGSDPMSLHC